jgi:putative hydrolase of HD superfamily
VEERLIKQIEFLVEIDKLKNIFRQNFLADGSRKENSAEHSWHLALFAMILPEFAEGIDVLKTMKLLLIHDLVEIYAGDVYCYDERGAEGKFEREKCAAETLFSMLPEDQKEEIMDLWLEFEKGDTKEAYFAALVDRLQPLLLNYHSQGKSWKEHGISVSQVKKRNEIYKSGPQALKELVFNLIEEGAKKGYLKE